MNATDFARHATVKKTFKKEASVMKNQLIKKVALTIVIVSMFATSVVPAFAGGMEVPPVYPAAEVMPDPAAEDLEVQNLVSNGAALCILDSYTGNIIQSEENVNEIINYIEEGQNTEGQYTLVPVTAETVNLIDNEAVLVIENSIVEGDIIQNVINNNYIINNITIGDGGPYHLKRVKNTRRHNDRSPRGHGGGYGSPGSEVGTDFAGEMTENVAAVEEAVPYVAPESAPCGGSESASYVAPYCEPATSGASEYSSAADGGSGGGSSPEPVYAAPDYPEAFVQETIFTIGSNRYTVNGQTLYMDVAPYIKDGRTFIPLRYAARASGVADENIVFTYPMVTLIKDNRVVVAAIGSNILHVNGEAFVMDATPELIDPPGRTMFPIRWLATALGCNVEWNAETREVRIY